MTLEELIQQAENCGQSVVEHVVAMRNDWADVDTLDMSDEYYEQYLHYQDALYHVLHLAGNNIEELCQGVQ